MEQIFDKIKKIVEKELECSAHNMDHIMRVYNLAMHIAKDDSGIDHNVLKASVLLHDIARVKEDSDHSWNTDHAEVWAKMAKDVLEEVWWFTPEQIWKIQTCILTHRFRSNNPPTSKEAKILFDADKLDSIWAIWISRAFIYVWKNWWKIYTDVDIDKYVKENLWWNIHWRISNVNKHSPYLEYETKFKFIVDKLYTKKAKIIWKDRITYHKTFLERLEQEIKWEN